MIFRVDIQPAEFKSLKIAPHWWALVGAYAVASLLLYGIGFLYHLRDREAVSRLRDEAKAVAWKNEEALSRYRIKDSETRELMGQAALLSRLFARSNLPWYHIFDELETASVRHLYIKNLKQENDSFHLRCFTLNLESATQFYKNALKSKYFSQVSYGDVTQTNLYSNNGIFFSLKFKVNEGGESKP